MGFVFVDIWGWWGFFYFLYMLLGSVVYVGFVIVFSFVY